MIAATPPESTTSCVDSLLLLHKFPSTLRDGVVMLELALLQKANKEAKKLESLNMVDTVVVQKTEGPGLSWRYNNVRKRQWEGVEWQRETRTGVRTG